MRKRNYIARVLLLVAFMFTFIFQFTHSYSHILSSVLYENEHSTHAHFNENREDSGKSMGWKEKHSSTEKCFACDFILNPYLSTDIEQVVFYNYEVTQKAQNTVNKHFKPLYRVYYSLRAPPSAV